MEVAKYGMGRPWELPFVSLLQAEEDEVSALLLRSLTPSEAVL